MIFNKESNGAEELKGLIGFIYRSVNFDNLQSYIEFAERDIKKVISPEVFDVALDHYNSENYHLEEQEKDHPEYAVLDELVRKIQYPVAVHAYRRYVPSADLTHSNKGRQIFVSENEKPAFEWQIEKDNENLLRLANEATDMLIEFLDECIDDVAPDTDPEEGGPASVPLIPWGTSDAYKLSKSLLIPKVDIFEQVFMIGSSRMTFLALAPFLKRIQEHEIKACITPDRYDEILEQFLDDDLSEENTAIVELIRPPMALLALSVAVKRLSAEILPSGIFNHIVTNVVKGKSPASKQDRNEISASLEKDGMRELLKLQEHIRRLAAVAAGEEFTTESPADRIDTTLKFVRL